MFAYFRRSFRRSHRFIKFIKEKIMALPKWLRKLVAILEILFERNANQGKAIAELTARLEKVEAALGANNDGDVALAKRIEELTADSAAQDAEADELFAGFKTGTEEEPAA
jgi:hypothetical protein